jgi:hypothetical protein
MSRIAMAAPHNGVRKTMKKIYVKNMKIIPGI